MNPSHPRPATLLRLSILAIAAAAFAGSVYRTGMHVEHMIPHLAGLELAWGVVLTVLLGVGAPAAGLLSLVLAWRVWNRADARVLALFLALLAYALGGDGFWTALTRMEAPLWLLLSVDTLLPLAVIGALASIIRFSAVFPRPLTPADVAAAPALSRGPLAPLAAAAQRWTLRPRALPAGVFLLAAGIVIPVQITSYVAKLLDSSLSVTAPAKTVLIGMMLCGMLLTAGNLHTGYRRTDAAGRRRVYWILEGLLAATVILGAASVVWVTERLGGFQIPVDFWFGAVAVLAFLALLACIAVAMFGAGALDPSLAMKRTAAAGMAGAAMVLLFAVTEQIVQELLVEWLGLSDRAGALLTGASVALLFEPVRKHATSLAARLLRRGTAAGQDRAAPAVRSEPAGA